QFHDSLRHGNLKRLNLDVFFALSTPTAQRMYRFLDKRFYTSPKVTMDLVEFACGHVGLTDAGNVALLKRRLAPAVAELARIGYLAAGEPSERYQRVRAGVWRVQFEAGAARPAVEAPRPAPLPLPAPAPRPEPSGPAAELAREFYALWEAGAPAQPGAR